MFTVGEKEFTDLLSAKRHGIKSILSLGMDPTVTKDVPDSMVESILEKSNEVIAILKTKERIRPPGPQPGKPRKPRKPKTAPTQSNPTA